MHNIAECGRGDAAVCMCVCVYVCECVWLHCTDCTGSNCFPKGGKDCYSPRGVQPNPSIKPKTVSLYNYNIPV